MDTSSRTRSIDYAVDSSQCEKILLTWSDSWAGYECDQVVKAKVVRIEQNNAWLSIGSKFETPIPLTDWKCGEPAPVVGDEATVLVGQESLDCDRPIDLIRIGWEHNGGTLSPSLVRALARVQSCKVIRKVEEGFVVDIGVNALLPNHKAPDLMLQNSESFIGKEISCRIIRFDEDRRMVQVATDFTIVETQQQPQTT